MLYTAKVMDDVTIHRISQGQVSAAPEKNFNGAVPMFCKRIRRCGWRLSCAGMLAIGKEKSGKAYRLSARNQNDNPGSVTGVLSKLFAVQQRIQLFLRNGPQPVVSLHGGNIRIERFNSCYPLLRR